MTTRAAKRRHLPSSPFKDEPEREIESFEVDDRVTHDRYGLGRIVTVEESAVTAEFGQQQVRVASPFDKLTKL